MGILLLLVLITATSGFTSSRRYSSSTSSSTNIPWQQPTQPPSRSLAISAFHPLFTHDHGGIPPDQSSSNFVNNRHSASDWFYNVRTFLQSEILREVKGPVLAVAGWSAVVSVVHRICLSSSSKPLATVAQHMCVPGTAHSFLVSALGLLLVFRTNSAYQRFYVRFIHS